MNVCIINFFYYFNLCRQSDLTSLIHNKGLCSTFPNVSIALRMFMCLMVSIVVPVNVRSVEWRYGEEQIATTDERLSIPALERLSVENDLLAIYMYILVALLTQIELQTAESVCKL